MPTFLPKLERYVLARPVRITVVCDIINMRCIAMMVMSIDSDSTPHIPSLERLPSARIFTVYRYGLTSADPHTMPLKQIFL